MPFELYNYLGAFVKYCDQILVNFYNAYFFTESWKNNTSRVDWSSFYAPYLELCWITKEYKFHCEVLISGQISLANTSVLIVGAGGLGCPAAIYLAAAGIGEFM